MNEQGIIERILGYYDRVIIGVDGKDGSGKTTFADKLAHELSQQSSREIIRVSLDNFFNPRIIRKRNANEARGNYEDTFDLKSIAEKLLKPFCENGRYTNKVFDYDSDKTYISGVKQASADAILLVDGVFLQRPELRSFWDIVILIEVEDEVAIERGSRRDAARIGSYEAARQKFVNRYIASQKIYYSECEPQKRADFIVDNSDFLMPKSIEVS